MQLINYQIDNMNTLITWLVSHLFGKFPLLFHVCVSGWKEGTKAVYPKHAQLSAHSQVMYGTNRMWGLDSSGAWITKTN